MRVVKEAEERRNEILDAADMLFADKGFDNTSTSDILEKVGIARGTLYYHFKSKEDILDALIKRCQEQIINAAGEIAADKGIPVPRRITGVVRAMSISHESGKEMKKQMHKPQNALMHQKSQAAVLKGVTPILTEVVQDGIREGLFSTPYPRECMEMLLVYAGTVFDDMMDDTQEVQEQRIRAFIFHAERMLERKAAALSRICCRCSQTGPLPAMTAVLPYQDKAVKGLEYAFRRVDRS